jgi:hypothetical protein
MPADPREYGKRTRAHAGWFNHILERRREFKRERFLEKIAGNYQGPIILAEGDSWFEYPMSEDLLMRLGEKYAVLSLAKAADSFAEVDDQDELFPTLNHPPAGKQYHIVMLSLGGNEIMGRIEDFTHENEVDRADEDYLLPSFDAMLGDVRGKYSAIIQRIIDNGEQHVILHGYDYPDPRFPPEPTEGPNGSQWIGPPLMHERGIGRVTTWRAIANQMLEKFNATLAELAARPQYRGRVHHVRLLGTIGKRNKNQKPDETLWVDEIHGSTKGFRQLAKKFEPVIKSVWEGMQVG